MELLNCSTFRENIQLMCTNCKVKVIVGLLQAQSIVFVFFFFLGERSTVVRKEV